MLEETDDVDAEADEVLKDLQLLTESEEVATSDIRPQSMLIFFLMLLHMYFHHLKDVVFAYIKFSSSFLRFLNSVIKIVLKE